MTDRLKLLKQNRQLILETLEHVQNVTNLGIKVEENTHSIAISLPQEVIPISDTVGNRSFIRTGAQLVFTQDPNNGIKIRHKLPQVKTPGKPLTGEVVTNIPPSQLSREVIFETVIEFLERVKGVQ
jgi:hypothetical protein